jgi:hypothetical protein
MQGWDALLLPILMLSVCGASVAGAWLCARRRARAAAAWGPGEDPGLVQAPHNPTRGGNGHLDVHLART